MKPIIEMKGIRKQFPGVLALDNVELTLFPHEIHAIMGENGAGKSTLIKCLTGVHQIDDGFIKYEDKEIHPESPIDVQEIGISTVYQEVNLCPNLSVAENIYIGREPRKLGFIDWKTMNAKAKDLLEELNLKIDVTKTLNSYSVAIQQMVAIARALAINCKVLILDEPTSSLDEKETQLLFNNLLKLKEDGISIVFISHFIEQIYAICDRVTILRNGQFIETAPISDMPTMKMISLMLGKEVGKVQKFTEDEVNVENEKFVEVENVKVRGKVRDMNLSIARGEVVGFAGLLGSGRTEAATTLFGLNSIDSGHIKINDKAVNLHSPYDAMMNKIALCPEDRRAHGIIRDLSVRENIALAIQSIQGPFHKIPASTIDEIVDEFIEKLQIKVSSPQQLVKTLSGGNQQKVILARWLASKPELMILDEPTRGIDIGTKTEIQNLMIKLAHDENMAVLFISSEFDELINTCSRLAVFRDQKIIGQLRGKEIEMNNIMNELAGE